MRKKILHTLLAVVAVGAVVLGTQSAAQAEEGGHDSNSAWVQQTTATGDCFAKLTLTYINSAYYASGYFQNYQAGWACTGWLERSTNAGSTWSKVSGDHKLFSVPATTEKGGTSNYYDGLGYLARACFQLDFVGAARHCTYAL